MWNWGEQDLRFMAGPDLGPVFPFLFFQQLGREGTLVSSCCTMELPDSRTSLPWWILTPGQNKSIIPSVATCQWRKATNTGNDTQSGVITLIPYPCKFKGLWDWFVGGLQESGDPETEEPLNVRTEIWTIVVRAWEIIMLAEKQTVKTTHRF